MKFTHLIVLAIAAMSVLAAGCMKAETTATPQEEEKFRNPDKNPPPEAMAPKGPPPNAGGN